MQQFSSQCPHCGFVLQFYDASLFGRRGRCPKCRNKFVLEQPEPDKPETLLLPDEPPPRPMKPAPAAAEPDPVQAEPSASPPAAAKPVRPAAAVVAAAAKSTDDEAPWETSLNRGLGTRKPVLSPHWVLPNAFALSTLAVVAIGAATGMGAANLWINGNSPLIQAAAAAAGGIVGAGLLIRRYDPLRPKT